MQWLAQWWALAKHGAVRECYILSINSILVVTSWSSIKDVSGLVWMACWHSNKARSALLACHINGGYPQLPRVHRYVG